MNLDIQEIKAGKTSVFRAVVDFFWPRLFKFCCIYVTEKEIAKDIIQEAFISLWENKHLLSDKTELITYLMVICRNKCLNYLRDKQRNKLIGIELTEEAIYLKANQYTLEDESSLVLDALDLHMAISNALSVLRPKTREIFHLRYYEGLTVGEISLKTNLAEKTVSYHLSKSLKELKGKLSPTDFLLILFFSQL